MNITNGREKSDNICISDNTIILYIKLYNYIITDNRKELFLFQTVVSFYISEKCIKNRALYDVSPDQTLIPFDFISKSISRDSCPLKINSSYYYRPNFFFTSISIILFSFLQRFLYNDAFLFLSGNQEIAGMNKRSFPSSSSAKNDSKENFRSTHWSLLMIAYRATRSSRLNASTIRIYTRINRFTNRFVGHVGAFVRSSTRPWAIVWWKRRFDLLVSIW